jgi:two-component system, OmpR family, response regulator
VRELRRILLVDDDRSIRAVARLALERVGGFTVDECASGREVPDVMTRFAPDLVLLDVVMPDVNGPEVLHSLRAKPETASVPVVFLTARTSAEDTAKLHGSGVIGVLAKPFDPMTLSDEIREIWRATIVG